MNHKSKRIAVISFHTSPLARLGVVDAGGMNVYIYNLAQHLSKKGWQIDVFTRKESKDTPETIIVSDGFRVISLGAYYQKNKHELRSHIADFTNAITDFMTRTSMTYDVLHAHYFLSGLVGVQLSKECSIPLVQTFHTLGFIKQTYGGTNQESRIDDEKLVVAHSDSLIVSTEFEKETLIAEYQADAKRIVVVPPGVDTKTFKPQSQKGMREKLDFPVQRKLVVFVGRIDPIKGITTLIQALGDLTTKHPDFHKKVSVFLIGGDIENADFWHIPAVKHIQDLIVELGLECCVKFLGAKPHSELALYYSASDVVVMPSLYESFSLVTLEAMASGSCVLGSRVGGLRFLIEDGVTGRLFENKNVDQLCSILYELLEDSQERKRLGTNAHQFAATFSWDMQAAKIEEVYQRLKHT